MQNDSTNWMGEVRACSLFDCTYCVGDGLVCVETMMPRRKKKFMLLRGHSGNFIVVERIWYDFTGIARQRGNAKRWWIVAESDDCGAMQAMASLTDKHLKMEVNHTYEEKGRPNKC